MPLSKWLGRRKEDETQRRKTTAITDNSLLQLVEQSSLRGLFLEDDDWDCKSKSDSSYTNLSEAEASWLLAFDDLMSQVSSKVSGMDEFLDVLSLDGEDPNLSGRYAITVETKNPTLRPKRKGTKRNKEDRTNSDIDVQPRFCVCLDDFTFEDKFNCMDSSGFWESLRSAFGAHCDDAGDFVDMLQAKTREKMEFLSRLDADSAGSPILRTSSGRRVQFEFDMKPVPFWARRSWQRSGLNVIPKSNNDKAAATTPSCLKKPMVTPSDGPSGAQPPASQSAKDKIKKEAIGPTSAMPSETPEEDDAASMNSLLETNTESKTTACQANSQDQSATSTSPRKPKLKLFVSVAAVARKVLPLPRRSVVTRPQVKSLWKSTKVESLNPAVPTDGVHIESDPDPVAPPLQELHGALKSQGTPQAVVLAPKPQEPDSIAPKTPEETLPLDEEKVPDGNRPSSPLEERPSKGSQSSDNSTLLEEWSSFGSKTSEDSMGLKFRLLERFSTDPPGTYSPSTYSPEGLTIECHASFASQEEKLTKEYIQPVSSPKSKRINPPTTSRRKDIHSISATKPHKKNSPLSKTRKHATSISPQKVKRTNPSAQESKNGTRSNPQGSKPRQVIPSLSSQLANTTNQPMVRKRETEMSVADPKVQNMDDTNTWFNFDELDDNGFPANHFRVDKQDP